MLSMFSSVISVSGFVHMLNVDEFAGFLARKNNKSHLAVTNDCYCLYSKWKIFELSERWRSGWSSKLRVSYECWSYGSAMCSIDGAINHYWTYVCFKCVVLYVPSKNCVATCHSIPWSINFIQLCLSMEAC